MNPKLKEKLELSLIGYGFVGLNLYAISVGRQIFGFGFGVIALIFFIRALRIKQ